MVLNQASEADICHRSNRRRFLRTGTMALVSAGLWLEGKAVAFGQENVRAASGSPSQQSKTRLTRSTFTPYLTQYFSTKLNGAIIYLQLITIGDLQNVSISSTSIKKQDTAAFQAKLKDECFTLLFASSNEVLLPQEAWTLSHPSLGNIEIFLVPVERPLGSLHYYQAVFNRLM